MPFKLPQASSLHICRPVVDLLTGMEALDVTPNAKKLSPGIGNHFWLLL